MDNIQINVQNITTFKSTYKEIVHQLIKIRKETNLTQQFLGDWLGVDRRKIMAFENLKIVDIEILLLYCDKFSIEINLTYKIN